MVLHTSSNYIRVLHILLHISVMAFISRPVTACLFLMSVICGSSVVDGRPPSVDEQDDSNGGVHWALIVAGSAGWDNYRHQVRSHNAAKIVLGP